MHSLEVVGARGESAQGHFRHANVEVEEQGKSVLYVAEYSKLVATRKSRMSRETFSDSHFFVGQETSWST